MYLKSFSEIQEKHFLSCWSVGEGEDGFDSQLSAQAKVKRRLDYSLDKDWRPPGWKSD